MAVCTLVLLGTSFLPILGVEFAWVQIHWMTGIALALLVLVHIVRSVAFRPLRTMLPGVQDIRDTIAVLRYNIRATAEPAPLPGKYSVSQKAIHAVFALVVLTAIVTGFLMLAKIDSPLWERNPYFLSDPTWGVIYVLHGFSALALISLVMIHMYFSLRPEKRHYLRSMLTGTMTRNEHSKYHDARRWPAEDEA